MCPSVPSNEYNGNSSKMTCRTVTFLLPTTASDFGPFDSSNTGCNAITALPITATAKSDNQRDHSRTAFDRSKAIGTTSAKTIPIATEGTVRLMSSHRATANPNTSDKPPMRLKRIASFTFEPNRAEKRSKPTHTTAGASPTSKRKTKTSNGDNFAAEKTVVFLPYRSSKG